MGKEINFKTYEETCLSNLNTGGGGETESMMMSMAEADSGIVSTEAVLTALVDGGDTESLNAEVEYSIPEETQEVYNELLNNSPYLSETVVGTSIEKETVLPNSMLRDVMVANPHTARSLELLQMLDERLDPMPAYMKAQILAGRSIQSLKSELEGQLAGYRMQKARAMKGLARHFRETSAPESLLALYQADNSLHSRYMVAWLHLQRAEYQQGQAVMNGIPTLVSLSDDESAEYQDMLTLFTMLKSVFETGGNLIDLTPAQLSQVQTLEANGNGFAAVYARNIRIALGETDYEEPVLLPDPYKSAAAVEEYQNIMEAEAPGMLQVFPNPAKDFVILGYALENETNGTIEVRDIKGTLVYNRDFSGKQDQLTVSTSKWIAGTYVINLMIGDKTIETVKLTITN